MAEDPRQRLDPAPLRPLLRADDDARAAVCDPGSIAGGRRALRVEHRTKRGERLERRVPADALVRGDLSDGDDLVIEPARVLRGRRALVRARRPCVLVLAGDPEIARDDRRLLDHVQSVEGRREPVENHVVEHLAVAQPVAETRLRQQIRRARHRLHSAGHDDVVTAGGDHQLGDFDRADGRGAHLVDRVRGNLLRDPSGDRRLARGRLARTCLEHLAHDDVAHLLGVDAGPLEPRADRDGAELGRGNVGETASETAERRANSAHDHCPRHVDQRTRGLAPAGEGGTGKRAS